MTIFALICFAWAIIGIGSRIIMGIMGSRWKDWELGKAYTGKRPAWVVIIGIAALGLIAFTWYQVAVAGVALSWIVGVLVSLTGLKVIMFLFQYDKFREFAVQMLSDGKKMATLNIGVVVFSGALIALGIFLYS